MSVLEVEPAPLDGILILKPKFFRDERGFFMETFSLKAFQDAAGRPNIAFVQDNQSRSSHGVLRGLHYQRQQQQGKLVRVIRGRIWDVCVDLRRHSKTFGRWFGIELDGETQHQVWIPEGFAHGFVTLSDTADVAYKATDYYAPEFEECIRWNDEDLGIKWPDLDAPFNISKKDLEGKSFRDANLPE